MRNRFENAKDYLIELLRAYGHRPVIVKIKQDGEEVVVMARSFVKRQLTAAGIMFPYNEANKKTTKIANSGLDNDELSIIFHKAVFELEASYIEEFCQGKPEAEAFVNSVYSWIERKQDWLNCTFSYYNEEEIEPFLEARPEPEIEKGDLSEGLMVLEEDVKTIKNMGYNRISNVYAMMELFWDFASRRQPIGKPMKNAILSLTIDEEAADYLTKHYKFYNRFIQEKTQNGSLRNQEDAIKELNKKHQAELEERNRKHKADITKLNTRHQEELRSLSVTAKEYKKLIDKYRKLAKSPYSKLSQLYDFTNKDDIKEFISWYRVLHKKVKNQTVRTIVRARFGDDESAAELFKKMVDDYNSTLIAVDDVNEEIEACTE